MSTGVTDPTTPAAPAQSLGDRVRGIAWQVVRKGWFIALLIFLWWLVTAAGWVDPYKLPSPSTVFSTLGSLFTDRALLDDLGATLLRLVEGWAIGVAAGVLLGILTGGTPFLEDGIRPVIAGLQSVPTIAFLPLAILWFGFNGTAVLVITAFGTRSPVERSRRSRRSCRWRSGATRSPPRSQTSAAAVRSANTLVWSRDRCDRNAIRSSITAESATSMITTQGMTDRDATASASARRSSSSSASRSSAAAATRPSHQ